MQHTAHRLLGKLVDESTRAINELRVEALALRAPLWIDDINEAEYGSANNVRAHLDETACRTAKQERIAVAIAIRPLESEAEKLGNVSSGGHQGRADNRCRNVLREEERVRAH